MPDFKVGVVTHHYDKIGVVVADLTGDLAVGDKIKIIKDKEEFSQEVSSMQIEHQQVQVAKKGQTIGLKVDQPVKEGAEIYIIRD